MASAITLAGIDEAISNLKYINENTLKYRFIRQIRQYYIDDNSIASLKEIEHTALIGLLWDTDGDPETFKNKRKNLNSLRSSINTDLKTLYEKGVNPEGIKIGSDNIFVMSEDAKDNILNTFGYDLQPEGKLKLDQIMDILKLANETISDSMADEDTTGKDDLRKKGQLKDLIKTLSAKLGLGALEFPKTDADFKGQQSESQGLPDDIDKTADVEIVDGDKILSEIVGIEDEEVLGEIGDIKEDEILDTIEAVDEDSILDVVDEDFVTDNIEDPDSEILAIEEEIDEDFDDETHDENTELEYVDVSEDDGLGDGIGSEAAQASGTGDANISEGLDLDQRLGQGETVNGLGETGSMIGDLKPDSGAFDKGDKKGPGVGTKGKDDENGAGSDETNIVFDDAEPDAVDEITKLDDVIEIETMDEKDPLDDVEEDPLDDVEDIVTDDAQDAAMDDIEDSDSEILAVEEAIDEDFEEAVDDEDTKIEFEGASEDDFFGDNTEKRPQGDSGIGENEIEQLGLPMDSLGREYGSEQDTKLKKDKLLAEAFDGYLGSMDRYYNHYILIDRGEYLIGSRHPKKNERAEQTMHLSPFYFGRFPVTNGLFEIFVEKTGFKTTAEKIGYGTVYYGRFEKRKDDQTGLITSTWNSSLYCKVVKGACWYRPSGPESTLYNKRNHPVVQISLEDAAAFAAWTGKRLPTENEWEAAARTAKGWIFPWGHEWKNDAANIEDSGIADTTPVDKYVEFENGFGIVDVLGNVLEWTDSGFKMPSQGNNESPLRIAKGGSWVSGNDIRLSSRFKLEPESHSNILGFRCVAV
jgi:formylglycine-generating enzyme required for sulfatase activity